MIPFKPHTLEEIKKMVEKSLAKTERIYVVSSQTIHERLNTYIVNNWSNGMIEVENLTLFPTPESSEWSAEKLKIALEQYLKGSRTKEINFKLCHEPSTNSLSDTSSEIPIPISSRDWLNEMPFQLQLKPKPDSTSSDSSLPKFVHLKKRSDGCAKQEVTFDSSLKNAITLEEPLRSEE